LGVDVTIGIGLMFVGLYFSGHIESLEAAPVANKEVNN